MNSETACAAEQAEQEEQTLWQSFVAAESEEEYFQKWLSLQGELIGIARQGVLVAEVGDGRFSPVAAWTVTAATVLEPAHLSGVIERVLEERIGLLVELAGDDLYGAAYPVVVDDSLTAVVALELHAPQARELQQAMHQLQWGTSWLELLVRRNQLEADRTLLQRLKGAVDLLGLTMGESTFAAASLAFVTELATACGCERVSFGYRHAGRVKIEAVSHSAEIDKKMNLTRSIERVMEEAILQRREVVYPAVGDEMLISREHENLSRQQSMASIATFPLFHDNRYYGALTCERAANAPFSVKDLEYIRAVVTLAGPALQAKHQNDLNFSALLWQGGRRRLAELLGSSHLGKKVLILALLAGLGVLFTTDAQYRLTADARLEGAIQRAVVVPFDGFLDEAPVTAGDRVQEGELLCSLDDRDLLLEKLAKLSRTRQLERQYQEAVAKHDRAETVIVRARLEQARAELDLLETKLERTMLMAPFTGLVVSGDLSQRLGSAVGKGEILFEITPLDAYRIILEVDERRVADVAVGQSGSLVLSSFPQENYTFVVTKITPVARADEGRNYFRVEASLDEMSDKLRPGMEGVAKVEIDTRRAIQIWTRDLMEWARISFWTYMP